MKRSTALVTTGLLSAAVLTACSGTESESAGENVNEPNDGIHDEKEPSDVAEDEDVEEVHETENEQDEPIDEEPSEENTADEIEELEEIKENEENEETAAVEEHDQDTAKEIAEESETLQEAPAYTLIDQETIDQFDFNLEEREAEFGLTVLVPSFLPHNFNEDNAMLILGSGHHSSFLSVNEATAEDYLEDFDLETEKEKHMEKEQEKSAQKLDVVDVELEDYPPLAETFDYYLVTSGYIEGNDLPVPNQFLNTDTAFHTLVRVEKDRRIIFTFNYELEKETDALIAEFLQIAQSIEINE
ncbi:MULTISPECIES: hypothetical protein [Alteribacter]|uniref:Uncharacterized protein n=1 Tax=Alteribacter keqinensis TaxID=2483800 RepID=A0A3M7TR22_9BACI|nr:MULTISPECIES: hypothetical protein [Alteribacter]MBM7095471.1 hypothetical protein [Alteribacter salitolerans]RNA67925.1 hypothetical protein EBO34_14610 [Alteribacter keqinensis]